MYNFKKLLVVSLAALLIFGAGNAFGDQGGEGNNTNCNGVGNINSPCGGSGGGDGNGGTDFPEATGDLKVGAIAGAGAVDFDSKSIHGIFGGNGGAFGISGAGGIAGAKAEGGVIWGSASAYLTASGGGLTSSNAGLRYYYNRFGLLHVGVGSVSTNEAVTSASADINAKALAGFVGAKMGGIAAQGTLNGSHVEPGNIGIGWLSVPMNTDGFTGGIAGQGSIGGFTGGAIAPTIFWIPVGADMEAGIHMLGTSGSDSFRFVDYENGAKTEGLHTDVWALTQINTIGSNNGLAFVDGGFVAGGFAKSLTVQGNQYGGAAAYAVGHYSGSGNLGTNYNGSAQGYTQTTITTVDGMKGSINSSAAGMQVTSQPWIAD